MRDNIPDALITAFERQYDSSWNDPQLRNERMAMRYGWAAAIEQKQCIQEPAPATAMDALREAEAALEVAMARILKADPGHSICVTSEAKALVAVRAALAAPAAVAVPDGWKLVPELPTQDMCESAKYGIDARLSVFKWADGYKAMLSSAPEFAALAATPAAEHATLLAELATQAAQPVLPTGWVPCVVTYEGQHPEEVAYGPQIMMDRLKKWLERYFEMKAAAPVVLPEPVAYMLLDKDEPKTGFIFAKDSGGEWHGSTPLYTEQQLRGLLGNDAPAGSGGWKIHAENMERDRNYWRDRAQTMHEHQKGECWYWQGDGNDNPESMVNSLPVVIRADVLRALLATGGQAQAHAVEQEPFGYFKAEPFGWTDCGPDDEGAVALYEKPQVLATGGQAQAVASIYVTEDGQRECDDWKVPLPVGRNLLYAAPQAQADARDAKRYRWLRNPNQDVSLVLDKRTGYVPISEDGRTGGYGIYEYRAGCELDAAIDAAIAAAKGE